MGERSGEGIPLKSVGYCYNLMADYFERAAQAAEQRDNPFVILHKNRLMTYDLRPMTYDILL